MGHSLGLRGTHGTIKVGYQVAARLASFALEPAETGAWRLSGTVASSDAFWLSQSAARTLELAVGKQRWIWRDVQLEVGGSTVSGTVTGRPERR